MSEIPHRCKNSARGCPFTSLVWKQVRQHQRRCQFKEKKKK